VIGVVLILGVAVSVAAAAEATALRFSAPAFTQIGGLEEVVAADFNGDGTPDIANIDGICDNGPAVLLGRGDGTFGRPVASCRRLVFGATEATAVADVNGDGRLDIMILSFGSSGPISIWINDGAGRFHHEREYRSGTWADEVVAADLNADGIVDLVTENAGRRELVVLLGLGGGRFAGPDRFTGDITGYAGVATFGALAIGDVNGDGKPDAVFSSDVTRLAVARLGTGDGAFGPEHIVGHVRFGRSVVLADFNHDSMIDVAAALAKSNVAVFLGNGNGTFGAMARYAMDPGEFLRDVAVADFDGDGNTDMATFGDGDHLLVRAGGGDGTFGALQAHRTVHAYGGPVVADFNGDGRPDITYPAESSADPFRSRAGVGVSLNWSGRPAPPCVPGFLLRKSLRAAKRSIKRASCRLGDVRHRSSRKVTKNRVISQRPRSGAILPNHATVRLTVSRGRPR